MVSASFVAVANCWPKTGNLGDGYDKLNSFAISRSSSRKISRRSITEIFEKCSILPAQLNLLKFNRGSISRTIPQDSRIGQKGTFCKGLPPLKEHNAAPIQIRFAITLT
jgi:hypothetical protein